MGYLHISNLYSDTKILTLFRECYAMEKIHGTSAHVRYRKDKPFANGSNMNFFSGGEKMDKFLACFNQEELLKNFEALGHADVTVHGEAYGGRCQGMSKTYGVNSKFVAFDVKITVGEGPDTREFWLDVPNAEDVCKKLGLEFVHYVKVPCDLKSLDEQRDADSEQAIRNGCGPGHKREGIVVRPLVELYLNNGKRVIVKHKRDEFRETATPIEVDANRAAVQMEAEKAAFEWVTDMRMDHVLDKLKAEGETLDLPLTPKVITAMVLDIKRESEGILVWTDAIGKAVGTAARKMFHARVKGVKS